MTRKELEKFINKRLKSLEKIYKSKATEYARKDGLHNFNRLAELQRGTRERALIHLNDKQYISLHDMIDDLEEGRSNIPLSLWREKIGDNIVYMLLLDAMVTERTSD